MKSKLKVLSLVSIIIACFSMFIVGVFAVTEVDFKISGDIEYKLPPPTEEDYEYLTFSFDEEELTASVTACKSVSTVVVPGKILHNGEIYNVTSIASNVFADNLVLSSVTLSNSISSIGSSAFLGCVQLANIVLPTSLQTIEERLFEGCDQLKNITIPVSVTSIKEGAFSYSGIAGFSGIINYTGTEEQWNLIEGLDSSGIGSGVTINYNYSSEQKE